MKKSKGILEVTYHLTAFTIGLALTTTISYAIIFFFQIIGWIEPIDDSDKCYLQGVGGIGGNLHRVCQSPENNSQ